MQKNPSSLAEKILTVLSGEDFQDSVKALKIALILLPIPSCQPLHGAPATREVSHAECR